LIPLDLDGGFPFQQHLGSILLSSRGAGVSRELDGRIAFVLSQVNASRSNEKVPVVCTTVCLVEATHITELTFTRERGTIQGGLNRYFDYLSGKICGVHCVHLNHGGGTHRAYITLGPEGADLGSVDCSSTAVYVDCGNGGQNDS
jgi:hypothetical protein